MINVCIIVMLRQMNDKCMHNSYAETNVPYMNP